MSFERVVILDIDGLRRDVYLKALEENAVPHLGSIVSPEKKNTAIHIPAVSIAPSITFAAQASIFTGSHPSKHRVAANNFFDRIGYISAGEARHFGLDAGDTYAIKDAIDAFRNDLADRLLNHETPTIYESATKMGKTSLVAANMYNRGSQVELLPSVLDMARIFMGYGPIQMGPEDCDNKTLSTVQNYFQTHQFTPDLMTFYWVGMDLYSHDNGPDKQMDYLCGCIDRQVGELLELLKKIKLFDGTLFVIISDHGHIATPGDDAHTIRIGFPFDMELTPLFTELGLDLYDLPGEGKHVDAVVGLNGGMAYVYVKNREESWHTLPRYEEDVLPVAQAFYEMNKTGKYRKELQGLIDFILIRNVERVGNWDAGYDVYLGKGKTQPFDEWLEQYANHPYLDPVNRIRYAASSMSGDIILHAKAHAGVYFGIDGLLGVHGSLHRDDSQSVLSFSYPTGTEQEVHHMRNQVDTIIRERCGQENDRMPSIVDMAYVLRRMWLKNI